MAICSVAYTFDYVSGIVKLRAALIRRLETADFFNSMGREQSAWLKKTGRLCHDSENMRGKSVHCR